LHGVVFAIFVAAPGEKEEDLLRAGMRDQSCNAASNSSGRSTIIM
jgi:hypothetical protein